MHKNLKSHSCEYCGKRFGQLGNFKRHIETIHENINTNKVEICKCVLCEKTYGSKSNLLTHVKIVHELNKPFGCEYCEKKFGRKGHLDLHVKSVHQDLRY